MQSINHNKKKCSWYSSVVNQLCTAEIHRQNAVTLAFYQTHKLSHYSTKIMASSSCKELKKTNTLMLWNKCTPLSTTFSLLDHLDLFANFFCDKVQTIWDSIDSTISSDSSPYSYDAEFQREPLWAFEPISPDIILKIVMKSEPKSCELNLIQTSLLLECLDPILPSLTDVINISLSSGEFQSFFKTAIAKPLLKKQSLDHNDLKNYRPVYNIPFI